MDLQKTHGRCSREIIEVPWVNHNGFAMTRDESTPYAFLSLIARSTHFVVVGFLQLLVATFQALLSCVSTMYSISSLLSLSPLLLSLPPRTCPSFSSCGAVSAISVFATTSEISVRRSSPPWFNLQSSSSYHPFPSGARALELQLGTLSAPYAQLVNHAQNSQLFSL